MSCETKEETKNKRAKVVPDDAVSALTDDVDDFVLVSGVELLESAGNLVPSREGHLNAKRKKRTKKKEGVGK